MKDVKTWDKIGFAIGLVILVVGCIFLVSTMEHHSTWISESASFGADYYTYSYDSSRDISMNTAATARYLASIGEMVKKGFGFLFMSVGALTTVFYGKKVFVGNEMPVQSGMIVNNPDDLPEL